MGMGGEYRLVSEEEWQNLHDALDHETRMREMEAEAARRWQEIAEGRSGRNPFEWAYSDDPAGFNECRCDEPKPESNDPHDCNCPSCEAMDRDEPEPKGEWVGDREWESEPRGGCAGCSCAEDEQVERIARAVVDELMERLRAFVL